jgi:type II secretory pathway component PulM
MWETIIGGVVTLVVGLFGIWWKNRSDKTKQEELGEQRISNLHHQKNAAAKKAADKRLRQDLPEGKELIDALEEDARRAGRD